MGLQATTSKMSTHINTKFWYFFLTHQFSDIPTFNITQTVTPKPINHTIF